MDQLYSLLREFDNWQPENLPNKTAIHLWQTLVRIASKYGLHGEFTVSIETLGVKTGLKRSVIYTAIDVLRDKGRIEVKRRKGNQSAKYRLIPFCVHHTDTNPDANPNTNPDAKPTQTRTIKEGERERRKGIDERVMQRLGEPRAREGDSPSLAWAEKRLTQKQRLYLYTLEAMEENPAAVQVFARWLAEGRYTDAQIGGAVHLTKDRFERGKVDYPFDYLHKVLLDWERRGITTQEDVDDLGYQPAGLERFDEDGKGDGLWTD